MTSRPRVRTPVRLAVWFVLATVLPIAILGWLGHRTLTQQRELARQRTVESLDKTGALLAHGIAVMLRQWRDRAAEVLTLASFAEQESLTALVFTSDGVSARYGAPLLYYPPVIAAELDDARLSAGERAELVSRDFERAASHYRLAAAAGDALVQGRALVALARCLERLGESSEALATYDALARLRNVSVAGYPAQVIAHRERARLLSLAGSIDRSNAELSRLGESLSAGGLMLDRATLDEVRATLPVIAGVDDHRRAVADAVSDAWRAWQSQATGATITGSGSDAVVSTWLTIADRRSAAVLAPLATVMSGINRTAADLRVSLAIDRADEDALTGHTPSRGPARVASLGEAGLAASLRVAPLTPLTDDAESSTALFAGAFTLFAVLIAGASYAVFRSVSRELDVAGQQADFVATVSHEFRSPLTAMRHLTESLDDGGVSADRLPEYYRALAKETRRLQHTVETVLAFGRLDAPTATVSATAVDLAALVRELAAEMQASSGGHTRELTIQLRGEDVPVVRADRDAISLALRNLLDNAFKYSAPPAPIEVSLTSDAHAVSVAVADHGCGLTDADRRRMFQKFVRGSAAETLNVTGAGLGLAIVDRVIKAHGGRVDVSSVPGHGSTFTIVLPIATDGVA